MIVELSGLKKAYEEKILFDHYHLSLVEGESLVITGASGSGKSTLLNILGLIEPMDEGRMSWRGKVLKGIQGRGVEKIIRYDIGYLFQNFALLDQKSVYDNVNIASKYLSINRKEKEQLIEVALKRVGLEDKKHQRVYTLSGGEQQRVALARLIVKPSKVILADEPTGNLDDENAKRVMDILLGFKEEGKTIVVVTHDKRFIPLFDRHVHLD